MTGATVGWHINWHHIILLILAEQQEKLQEAAAPDVP